jgi:hypothetical protein
MFVFVVLKVKVDNEDYLLKDEPTLSQLKTLDSLLSALEVAALSSSFSSLVCFRFHQKIHEA